jgi:hypothetical protein
MESEVKQKIDENVELVTETMREIFKNIYDEIYTFNSEQIINKGNLYLVHTAFLLPDEFIKKGIHVASNDYLQYDYNYNAFSRFSVHFYTNDMVKPLGGRGNWENTNYAIIVKFKDIEDYLYSVNFFDTVGTYGIDYKCKDVYVVTPENEIDNIKYLKNWLSEDRIFKYKKCVIDKDFIGSSMPLYSSDKEKCETIRDVIDDIFTKKIIKKSDINLKFGHVEYQDNVINSLIMLNNENVATCFIPLLNVNFYGINNEEGDNNLYENKELTIKRLNELTKGRLFSLYNKESCIDLLDDDEWVLDDDGIFDIMNLCISFNQYTYDNSKYIFTTNVLLKNIVVCLIKKIHNLYAKNVNLELYCKKIFLLSKKYLILSKVKRELIQLIKSTSNEIFNSNFTIIMESLKKKIDESTHYKCKYLKYKQKYFKLKYECMILNDKKI